jgi:hypothetical protein
MSMENDELGSMSARVWGSPEKLEFNEKNQAI